MTAYELKLMIEDTLEQTGLYSDDAVNLLLGTCAQESSMGKYRRQIGGGPALGIFQIEPRTFKDIRDRYLRFKPELLEKILKVSQLKDLSDPEELVYNDRLSICIARVYYLRLKSSIPSDINGWAAYWKRWYNTPRGKGTEEEFIANFNRYVK